MSAKEGAGSLLSSSLSSVTAVVSISKYLPFDFLNSADQELL